MSNEFDSLEQILSQLDARNFKRLIVMGIYKFNPEASRGKVDDAAKTVDGHALGSQEHTFLKSKNVPIKRKRIEAGNVESLLEKRMDAVETRLLEKRLAAVEARLNGVATQQTVPVTQKTVAQQAPVTAKQVTPTTTPTPAPKKPTDYEAADMNGKHLSVGDRVAFQKGDECFGMYGTIKRQTYGTHTGHHRSGVLLDDEVNNNWEWRTTSHLVKVG